MSDRFEHLGLPDLSIADEPNALEQLSDWYALQHTTALPRGTYTRRPQDVGHDSPTTDPWQTQADGLGRVEPQIAARPSNGFRAVFRSEGIPFDYTITADTEVDLRRQVEEYLRISRLDGFNPQLVYPSPNSNGTS